MKKKKDRTKVLYYIIAIGCIFLFLMLMLSSILDIGERLRNISKYLEYAFYGVFVIVLYFLIIRPIIIIVRSPSLSIATTLDQNDPQVYSIYKRVSKNIVKNNNLPKDDILLLTKYRSKDELIINLQFVFDKSVKPDLNKIIISEAKTVLISTAICQSARFDMITVFAVNLKMIKRLVEKCGFRPSMKHLSKLTINVFSTALIAEGLENLKIEDIVPKTSLEFLNAMPYVGTIIESIIQGAANAIMTLRIGCVCRRYLFTDGNIITKEEIRKQAYKETMKLLPLVMAETISFFPKKIVRFFSNLKRKKDETGVVVSE